MKNLVRRTALLARGIAMFKDWDVWVAERFGRNQKIGIGTFRFRNGIMFAINYSTTLVGTFSEIWIMDFYERWYSIKQGDVVIDIGAHIGIFSVLAGSKGATVYAYEPTPASFELLKKNTASYAIHPFQLAVSGKPGELVLSEVDGRGSSGNTTLPIESASRSAPGAQIKVRATTLAEIFADNNIQRCDLLKLDCEGAEVDILRAMPIEISEKISNIAMEYHGNKNEVVAILKEKGFHIIEAEQSELGYLWAKRV